MTARSDRFRAICDRAKERAAKIWLTPMVDPQAPAGYLTSRFVEIENEVRLTETHDLVAKTVETIRLELGDAAAEAGAEFLGEMLEEITERFENGNP